jgi:hypothetical protein
MRALILSLAVLAAACTAPTETTSPPAEPAPPAASGPQTAEEATAQDTCGMARFHHLIGTDASAIDQSTLPPRTRIITPESMVTQDFSAERLNIITGTDGKVSSMRCF